MVICWSRKRQTGLDVQKYDEATNTTTQKIWKVSKGKQEIWTLTSNLNYSALSYCQSSPCCSKRPYKPTRLTSIIGELKVPPMYHKNIISNILIFKDTTIVLFASFYSANICVPRHPLIWQGTLETRQFIEYNWQVLSTTYVAPKFNQQLFKLQMHQQFFYLAYICFVK